MSVKFLKSGIVSSDKICECNGTNILINAEKYTRSNPYIISSSSNDGYFITDMYTEVTPGKTYYIMCSTDKEWSPNHAGSGSTGKVSFWLYLNKVFNANNMGYDFPVCFNTGNDSFTSTSNGAIWKCTIPDGYHMARVRFNTYSDGETVVTAKFWDVRLIPAEYFTSVTPPQ